MSAELMKKLFIIVCFLPILAFGQQKAGISFKISQKWTDALSEARATNKLIFLDLYTDWCGPCREMDNEVFPLKVVGDLYNASFINYKLNAEKGDGISVAKQYKVNSYPTYLFVNGNGELIYRLSGKKSPENFLQEGKNAIIESKHTRSIIELETLYPTMKVDKIFMYNYLDRLTKIKAPTENILEEYLNILTKEEQKDPKVIKLIVDNGIFNNPKLQLGIAIDILKANSIIFEDLKAKKLIKENLTISKIEQLAMENSLKNSIKRKDYKLFKKVYDLTPNFAENKFENKQTLSIEYYFGIKDYPKFKEVTRDFINNNLLKIPKDSLVKWDEIVYNDVKDYYLKKNDTSLNLEEELFSYLHTQSIQMSNYLSQSCDNFLKSGANMDELQQIKEWSLIAIQIAETNPKYYHNVNLTYHKIYLTTLYKLGEKNIALKKLEKLIAELPNWYIESKKQALTDLLEQMKSNKVI